MITLFGGINYKEIISITGDRNEDNLNFPYSSPDYQKNKSDDSKKYYSDSSDSLQNVNLGNFIRTLYDGTSGTIRGVYSEDILALPVVQQPSHNPGFVSNRNGMATQFALPESRNVIGLLAHNYLSGKQFFDLKIGDEISIVYGDGQYSAYIVVDIQNFQALEPNSQNSRFIDLETDQELSASELFTRVYSGDHHLTLQTCIQNGNIQSWGRLFVIANPI